jgi:GNAT superfamily N-acetyltransferase
VPPQRTAIERAAGALPRMSRRDGGISRTEAEERPELLATLLPDEPEWLPLRALLLSGRCRVFTEEAPENGFLVRSTDYPLVASAFSPSLSLFQWTLAMRGPAAPPLELLVPAGSAPWWRRRLSRWRELEVRLLAGPGAPGWEGEAVAPQDGPGPVEWWGDGPGEVRPAPGEVPGELRSEVTLALAHRQPLAVARVDGRPASFCHAPFETESLFDVAVYTLDPYRRRGLARVVFGAMAALQAEAGRRPVWSAYAANDASLALASTLGFADAGVLAAFRQPH